MEELDGRERPPVPPPEGEVCPECHGRGWRVVADGGAGTAVQCDCAKRRRGSLYLAAAGIPERHWPCRLDNFVTDASVIADRNARATLESARRVSRRYIATFFDTQENRFRESGLIYLGPSGIGKTHLAVAVLVELIERYQVRGRFIDFTAFLRQIQSTFSPDTSESSHEVLRPIIEAEVLVLDDLGAQKPTEWVQETLYYVMNTRYTRRRPTIFTSNCRLRTDPWASPEKVQHRDDASDPWSDRSAAKAQEFGISTRKTIKPVYLDELISMALVSRLHEMAEPIRMHGPDYRARKTPVH